MPSNLHLPEFRVTRIVIGFPAESMQGYYVRAENEIEARSLVRALTMKSADGSKDIPMFGAESLRVQYWKDPLYPLSVG